MTSTRRLCCLTIVLFVLLACPLCSTSAPKSLWGQKLKFEGPSCLWRLRPEAAIPALEELSTCILIQRLAQTRWTGFVYKAPGKREVELGLGGSGEHLTVWLFGKERNFPFRMTPGEWYNICVTWSSRAGRLEVYINGNPLDRVDLPHMPSKRLAPSGTLTLGASHFSVNGEVEIESGTGLIGEISLFRVWAAASDAGQLRRLGCSDGDVVSWARDLQQGKYHCPPEPDSKLQCAWSRYKIQMETFIVQSHHRPNCPSSMEEITDVWLKHIFPPDISIRDISVSPSHSCHSMKNSTPPQTPRPQDLEAQSNSSCAKCYSSEVFVNVHPATDVDVVQERIVTLLNSNSLSKSASLKADPDTISVLPVGSLLSAGVSNSEPTNVTPSQSPSRNLTPTVSATVTSPNQSPTEYLSPQSTTSPTTQAPTHESSSPVNTAVTSTVPHPIWTLSTQPTTVSTTKAPTHESSSTIVPTTLNTTVMTTFPTASNLTTEPTTIVTTEEPLNESSSTILPTTSNTTVMPTFPTASNLTTEPTTIVTTEEPLNESSSTILPTTSNTTVMPTFPTTSNPTTEPMTTATTEEPLNVDRDYFFRISLMVNVTGGPSKPRKLIVEWLEYQLEWNEIVIVLNPSIKDVSGMNVRQHTGFRISSGNQKHFDATFQVQVTNFPSVESVKVFIIRSLTAEFKNGSVTIQGSMPSQIERIITPNCSEGSTNSTVFGSYRWPERPLKAIVYQSCIKPDNKMVSRQCVLDRTDRTVWTDPDFTSCERLVPISFLDNVTVTTDNAEKVVDIIQDLVKDELSENRTLSPSDLTSIVGKLSEVVNISRINPAVGGEVVTIISDILNSETNVTQEANTFLGLTERMGDTMDFDGESLVLTAPSLALSMFNADREQFSGLMYGVSSLSSTDEPEVFLNQGFVGEPVAETLVTIALPAALNNFFTPGVRNSTRVQFQFYSTYELFEEPASETQNTSSMMSYIVSASVNNSHVLNLQPENRIVVTFTHELRKPEDTLKCVFWDVQMNNGKSGWNNSGCETINTSASQTSCLCNHLTHFGLLLDVSRAPISETDTKILTFLSYIGCGVSAVFLVFTLVTYIYFGKLRRDYPSKILINLSVALLGLCMLFLCNSWISTYSNYGLCISTAAVLHYFLLASFTWMGLEALHMYLALIRVFNTYIPSYLIKLCAVGWGLPLVIVSVVLAVDKDIYGDAATDDAYKALASTGSFCWIQNDICFYVAVVGFIALVLLGNVAVFIAVLVQLRRTTAVRPSDINRNVHHNLRAAASLTVLLGLTWLTGLLSFGPARMVLMYMFVIFNTLQGFFIFLFHCLMKANVRKQWRKYCGCCGTSSHFAHGGCSCTRKKNLLNSESQMSHSTESTRASIPTSSNQYNHKEGLAVGWSRYQFFKSESRVNSRHFDTRSRATIETNIDSTTDTLRSWD
ncbi:unnamed protein product [Ophioblennius macclurei]